VRIPNLWCKYIPGLRVSCGVYIIVFYVYITRTECHSIPVRVGETSAGFRGWAGRGRSNRRSPSKWYYYYIIIIITATTGEKFDYAEIAVVADIRRCRPDGMMTCHQHRAIMTATPVMYIYNIEVLIIYRRYLPFYNSCIYIVCT